jgi:hypothetical protein
MMPGAVQGAQSIGLCSVNAPETWLWPNGLMQELGIKSHSSFMALVRRLIAGGWVSDGSLFASLADASGQIRSLALCAYDANQQCLSKTIYPTRCLLFPKYARSILAHQTTGDEFSRLYPILAAMSASDLKEQGKLT